MIVPAWSLTAGALRRTPASVRAHCPRCEHNYIVDLDIIIAQQGELFCFWNRRPPCPARADDGLRCDGRMSFSASADGAGVWPTLMREDGPGPHEQAHAAWRAERAALKRKEDLWSFIRKRQLYRRKVRLEADRLLLAPEKDAVLESEFEMLHATPDRLEFLADVRVDVLRRLAHAREVDLKADVDLPRRAPRPLAR